MAQLVSSLINATVIFIILGSASPAWASMYFEPYVGYGVGSSKIQLDADSTESLDSIVGPAVGAKLGWFFDYIYIVFDTQTNFFSNKESSADSTLPLVSTGIGLGFDWNLPIRLFYTLNTSSSITINEEKLTVTGSRMALGYYLDKDIILAVEMVSADASKDDGENTFTSSFTATMLTLSFPLEFAYPQTPWREKARN